MDEQPQYHSKENSFVCGKAAASSRLVVLSCAVTFRSFNLYCRCEWLS